MNASPPLKDLIAEAVEPVSPFWPMKGYVSHNPIQGLEHLPFDEAFHQAKGLFGAEGYLPLQEYRALFQSGRITAAGLDSAMGRIGPDSDDSLALAARTVSAAEVHKLHLLHGIDALEPALLDWELNAAGVSEETRTSTTSAIDPGKLWQRVLDALDLAEEPESCEQQSAQDTTPARLELPFRRTLSDWLDELASSTIVSSIDQQVIKWTSAFVDEGMAGWSMPDRRSGFYSAWRKLAQHDASCRLLGIKNFAEKIAALPEDPEQSIQNSLQTLQIPEARWPDYLTRMLAQLPGWTGLVRWRGTNPDDPIQKASPIDVPQYLAVRLFYEQEFVEVQVRRQYNISGNLPAISQHLAENGAAPKAAISSYKRAVCGDAWRLFRLSQLLGISEEKLSGKQATQLLGWLDALPSEKQLPIWLEAYEESYRHELLVKIRGHHGSVPEPKERPLAQAAFCIDVRSEPFRRHFEAAGAIETFGYAGFFGIPISHRTFDKDESFPLCPVLLTPGNATYELPRAGQQEALAKYASGSRWMRFGEHLFHDMKHSPIASFLLVDVLGLFFSIALFGKTLLRRPFNALLRATKSWFVMPPETEIKPGEISGDAPRVSGVPVELTGGFSIEQQANFVEGGLRMIGLIENYGRFVVLCGHGSTTDNNPYSAALDCGACGGRHGDPNARTFAAMANNPQVRTELADRGLKIPADTYFLPAKHDTTSDKVVFYDEVDVPASHRDDLEKLSKVLQDAGEQQALDRCARIPGTPKNMTAKQAFAHVESRSFDWASTRPEWGLSGNAGFIIGRRSLTKGLNLGGRCFLHSYNALSDPEGVFLEKIMTAPLVVGEWINMQYYTSATDPWKYGSGSKVIHNVVAGVGVMYGAQSDLATGLPLQTVNDGADHFHEPMRLLILIEADHKMVGSIIAKHTILQQFFHNGWLNLVAVDPNSCELRRYNTDASWELLTL